MTLNQAEHRQLSHQTGKPSIYSTPHFSMRQFFGCAHGGCSTLHPQKKACDKLNYSHADKISNMQA
jgi:hypothetical protein